MVASWVSKRAVRSGRTRAVYLVSTMVVSMEHCWVVAMVVTMAHLWAGKKVVWWAGLKDLL